MRRTIPIAKLGLQTLIVSMLPYVAAEVLAQLFLGGGFLFFEVRLISIIVRFSIPKAIGLAIVLVLLTGIFFPNIRRPNVYRFTLLSAAVFISIALWLVPLLDYLPSIPVQDSMMPTYTLSVVAIITLLVYLCNFVLDAFIRDCRQQHPLPAGLEADHRKKRHK
jgi:hypothetical protein